ncbi:hypothetical protein [Solirubrobacter soli]|uniref:hypothetical protein n=1 Tax=Solirubrobacter soli TaxID=363832 RepID=UPI00041A0E8B|nr:hypothetical protein [Solirubrobacter soli]
MLRLLPAVAGFLLILCPTASAAPFAELPFVGVRGPAVCLQATGAPGELFRQNDESASLLTATATGLTPGGVLPIEGTSNCADVAGWPGGGGVLAVPLSSEIEGGTWLRAILREPGQDWGAPVDVLPPEPRLGPLAFAVAASERGDALVAASSADERGRGSVRVARRLPGGAFEAPERFTSRAARGEVRAAFAASGEAVVTWIARGPKRSDPDELWAAIGAPGARFAAPQNIGPITQDGGYALAVGADGRALVVFSSLGRLVAAERAPAGTFGPLVTISDTTDEFGSTPVAVLRPGGGAVVAWTSPHTAALDMRTREQAGPFGPAVSLARPQRLGSAGREVQARFVWAGWSDLVRAVTTADGRVMITWGHLLRRQGLWHVVPGVATVSFSGAEHEIQALGGGVRNIDTVTPVVLADGSRAVAWVDNAPRYTSGRVHIAREGSPAAAEPAAPKVTFTPPRSLTLTDSQPLVLRFTCDAACDVYAQLGGDDVIAAAAGSLTKAGTGRLRLDPDEAPLAPRGGGKVRVLLRSSAPGAHTVTARTLTLHLRRAKPRFPPRVLGLTATRDGADLIVRWHTAKPADPRAYAIMAFDDKGGAVGSAALEGKARTSFTTRIRDARKATTVTVYAAAENADRVRRTTVEVPR